MRNRIYTFIWRVTGWVPPEWSRRDLKTMYRYWTALYEARALIHRSNWYGALVVIERGLA